MTVYLTNSMLSRFNRVRYPSSINDDEGSISGEHWQRIFPQSDNKVQLSKDMICRICAKTGCTPLTDKLSGDYDILSAIRSITNISISVDDSLPKYICTECLEVLSMSLALKKTCESSDRKFRKILYPMGDPLLHSYPYSKRDFHLILHQMKLKRMKIEEQKEKERQKLEKSTGPKEKKIKCSSCEMTFPDKEKLAEHRLERQCMRRACEICGQLVLSITHHRRHIHKQSTPHKCPVCGKEFPIVARLKTHMLVHSDTFNFFCDLCPYKSKHKYYLVMHMRTHTGEKPYKCASCPATFVNPSNLNKHKLTHQEKQFKCSLCEKTFRTSAALREHHDAAHMNIKHTCSFCGRDFCYKSDLRKHEIRTHNRVKHEIGGEPTYKQVERLQKIQHEEVQKTWRSQQLQPVTSLSTATAAAISTEYTVEGVEGKEYIFFTDVPGMMPPQQQLVQQQPVEMLSDILKKNDAEVKMYEPQPGMGYF